jgi:FtsZ-interacting cell division protein ZipA
MATATIAALKTEIAQLEKELEKHRRALQILEGGDRPLATPPNKPTEVTQATQPSKPNKASKPSKQKPSGSAKPAAPPIKGLIMEVLKAKAPQKLAPVEIVQQIAKNGHTINLHNIHSRLSEMAKANAVKREDGQYWVQS